MLDTAQSTVQTDLSHIYALVSVTFIEPGYSYFLELIHQKDPGQYRKLSWMKCSAFSPDGGLLGHWTLDVDQDAVDLAALIDPDRRMQERVMVVLECGYDERIFPYRPHHYGFFYRSNSQVPVYHALNAALGGVPKRISTVSMRHFNVYLFYPSSGQMTYSVLIGNVSRFVPIKMTLVSQYEGGEAVKEEYELEPRTHAEVPVKMTHQGKRLLRIEQKGLAGQPTYIVGRAKTGEVVQFEHFFPYSK